MTTIHNYQDVIDSRDIIERIQELESERDSFVDDNESENTCLASLRQQWADENPEEWSELNALLELQEEAEGYSEDWQFGATLISDSYFKDYAQELAEDIGAINSDASWPNNCIDWDQAARELQMDYTSVDFDGVEYWVR